MQHIPDSVEEAIAATAAPVSRWRLVPFVGYQLVTQADFTSIIWILWLGHRGYSLAEIGLGESCYHLGRLLLNVPTGAFADAFGRKWSLVVASLLLLVSTSLLWWSPVLPLMALALFVDGAAATFRVGADQAYLFDALNQEGRQDRFARLFGGILAVSWLMAAGMGWIGAWLSDWSYAWPFGLTLGQGVVSLILALFLPEAPRERAHRNVRGMARIITAGARTVRERPTLLRLVVFASALWTASTLGGLYMQSVLKGRGFANGKIGLIIGVATILSAGATWLGGRLPARWRSWGPFTLLAALLGVGIVLQGTAAVVAVLVGLAVREVVIGLFEPLIATWTNAETSAEVRATVLSLQEAGFSVTMIWAFPLTGFLADRGGWGLAYGCVTAALGVVILGVLLFGGRTGEKW